MREDQSSQLGDDNFCINWSCKLKIFHSTRWQFSPVRSLAVARCHQMSNSACFNSEWERRGEEEGCWHVSCGNFSILNINELAGVYCVTAKPMSSSLCSDWNMLSTSALLSAGGSMFNLNNINPLLGLLHLLTTNWYISVIFCGNLQSSHHGTLAKTTKYFRIFHSPILRRHKSL